MLLELYMSVTRYFSKYKFEAFSLLCNQTPCKNDLVLRAGCISFFCSMSNPLRRGHRAWDFPLNRMSFYVWSPKSMELWRFYDYLTLTISVQALALSDENRWVQGPLTECMSLLQRKLKKNTRGFQCGLLSRQFYFVSIEEICKEVDE